MIITIDDADLAARLMSAAARGEGREKPLAQWAAELRRDFKLPRG